MMKRSKNVTSLVTRLAFVMCFSLLTQVCLAWRCTARDSTKPFDLYLLIGQSNMAGRGLIDSANLGAAQGIWMLNENNEWVPAKHPLHHDKPVAGVGPGLSFAKEMLRRYPSHPIGLVPCAVGGTSIDKWRKGAYDPTTHTHPFDDMAACIRIARRQGVFKGALWLQGEADSDPRRAKLYLEKLKTLIASVRQLTGDPQLPFVAGELGHFKERYENVNRQLKKLPAEVSGTALALSTGLMHKGDSTHFDTPSANEFGKRFATRMIGLMHSGDGKPNLQQERELAAQEAGDTSRINFALHKPVTVSSFAPGHPGSLMVDGKISRRSRWEAANGNAPHWVEIDLRKYVDVSGITVNSGIFDNEKAASETTQAAGFWSLKNFRLQYWDDANWTDFPRSEVHENRLVSASFEYSPAITTYRIRLVCDDGEPINIMEIEVFGRLSANMPEPPALTNTKAPQASPDGPREATITVTKKPAGRSLHYVGYNQGYFLPGTNVSGWVEYSQVNSFRVWTSMNAFAPEKFVQADPAMQTVEDFDRRKSLLRKNPEQNDFIHWEGLLPLYDEPDSSSTNAMVFNYALRELKRLGVDVILQMGSTDFDSSWTNKWKQWQRYYALAFYAAKTGDVTMFALQNEPNHRNSGPMKLGQWIMAMQIVSDAIHCAVEDVNRLYHKSLKPSMVGPVTAGQNTDWWTAIAKAIRTDYHERTIDHDLLQIFSTHSYNSPAVGYESRVNNIRELLKANHPAGKALPIVYTEIGRWMNAYLIDKEETMDSPSLFTEWAGIYTNNMKNGCYGMWAFKFANTASSSYPRGIKSGHHFTWQGKRIVEDAYHNLALNRPARASSSANAATKVTDGDKTDASSWQSDSTASEKWIEIDLGRQQQLGSAVIYTGSAGGVYTSPDRIRNFSLQYSSGGGWIDIPGTVQKENKYAQVFVIFPQTVTTAKLRFYSTDQGSLKVREIKVFAAGDGPSSTPDYNISAIQRTGQVVRLFAKGFRDSRPLYETLSSVDDPGLDACTSYDEKTGNYYLWLVQRGLSDYSLTLDLQALGLSEGSPVIAEMVNERYFGEVSRVMRMTAIGKLQLTLPPQTVCLLTIPSRVAKEHLLRPAADATVTAGSGAKRNDAVGESLQVRLDASVPANNHAAYMRFDLSQTTADSCGRILLHVNGRVNTGSQPFRMHVYAIPGRRWNEKKLNWLNAPLLDKQQAWIHEVGTNAYFAGELGFVDKEEDHILDVTELVKKHVSDGVSFVFIRETRQLGDDADKNRTATIYSRESRQQPGLQLIMP